MKKYLIILFTHFLFSIDAKEINIQLVKQENQLTIMIEDDGKGFNTANFNQPPKHNGMGWLNVQNRVTSLEGKMDVRSSPESGTSIFIEFNV